jgi:hypothetical protein
MTKILKPWRLVTIGNTVYQTRPRECNCQGCDRNNINLCPMIVDRRYEEPKYDCNVYGVILKKIPR